MNTVRFFACFILDCRTVFASAEIKHIQMRKKTESQVKNIKNNLNLPKKIPPFLQGVLWSVRVKNLDLKRDKVYIINQILSYGTLSMLRWLFETYSFKTIRDIFLYHPVKDYFPSRFHLMKNYVLGLGSYNLNKKRYVKNLPRDIR